MVEFELKVLFYMKNNLVKTKNTGKSDEKMISYSSKEIFISQITNFIPNLKHFKIFKLVESLCEFLISYKIETP